MYRLLVPLDNSMERANKQAAYVSALPCANESVEAVLAHSLTDEERSVPEDMQRADRVETVRRTMEMLADAGIDVDTVDLSPPPAEGILALAASEEFDEIVMGGRKRSPTEKAILGSVSQTVVLNAEIPVTVTGGT
ncbi:Nucleotide-binding protein, UspA family [Halanaeroarchaeum sp. HSR-CO]|uniref:universal stress protein n=1 Tax=Halanaeroarchaeum sp. HSR-CO TaxID=2866382 RepID=UPI00217E2BBE|nr:universal stress protein [Halanaeroarchaeum sp. HSR-CO]UWG48422.1 Nucleotide-binding protein, UspA family [Halanaeroarchaeum sp. HSR-CO]